MDYDHSSDWGEVPTTSEFLFYCFRHECSEMIWRLAYIWKVIMIERHRREDLKFHDEMFEMSLSEAIAQCPILKAAGYVIDHRER